MDVINFAQNKATKCLQNENLIDKESASLLWNFIVLLCRQNGVSFLLACLRQFLRQTVRQGGSLSRGLLRKSIPPVIGGKWNLRACGLG